MDTSKTTVKSLGILDLFTDHPVLTLGKISKMNLIESTVRTASEISGAMGY